MLFPLQRLVPFRFIRFLETHLDSVRLHSSMISSCHPGATHFDRSTNTTTPAYIEVPGSVWLSDMCHLQIAEDIF